MVQVSHRAREVARHREGDSGKTGEYGGPRRCARTRSKGEVQGGGDGEDGARCQREEESDAEVVTHLGSDPDRADEERDDVVAEVVVVQVRSREPRVVWRKLPARVD